MADWGGLPNKSRGFGGGAVRDEDFGEEDVWGVAKERDDSCPNTKRASKESSGSSSAWHLSPAPPKIPRANTTPPTSDAQVVQGSSSAPMDIPDWSKIYGKNGKKKKKDGSLVVFGDGVSNKGDGGDNEDEDDGDADGDGDMIPPHEWIARKLARSQISSFSVCEGMGRTLKGRDLSKVRNAILTKTGFIE